MMRSAASSGEIKAGPVERPADMSILTAPGRVISDLSRNLDCTGPGTMTLSPTFVPSSSTRSPLQKPICADLEAMYSVCRCEKGIVV